nr:uncharacterized protein LOC120952855 [Anopheles coluzzii]
MPPTVATNSSIVNRDYSTHVNNISTCAIRRSSAADAGTLAATITTRRSQKNLTQKNAAGRKTTNDLRHKLIDCKVVLQNIFAQNVSSKEISQNEKDSSSVIHIDISANNEDDNTTDPVQEQQKIAAERISNVTRRTKPRRTKTNENPNNSVEKQRHTISVVPDDHSSIIHLDESSVSTKRSRNKRNTQSIAEIPDLKETGKQIQTDSNDDDVIVQALQDTAVPEKRRTARRVSFQTIADSGKSNVTSRLPSKRKPGSIIPSHESGVSPPKRAPDTQPSILEHSSQAVSSANNEKEVLTVNVKDNVCTGIGGLLDKIDKHVFKSLIISIKRIVPVLPEAELKRLKYPEPDSTQETTVSQHSSSSRATELQGNNNVTEKQRTLEWQKSSVEKPQIVVTSPIIEVPESPTPAPESKLLNVSNLAPPNTAKPQADTFKKPHSAKIPPAAKPQSNTIKNPHPAKLPPLPLLIEEENDDVYEFLSSSQQSDSTTSSKPARKTKQKKEKKRAGQTAKKNLKTATTKPKAKSQKSGNVFGFDKKALTKVIKNIGGGPVKQPAKTDYKINMEIPKTPPVVAPPPPGPPTVHTLSDNLELHFDDHPPLEASRILNPAVQRLKPVRSQGPLTSTPAQKSGLANSPSVASISCNPASPWRLQEDMIVPRTSYMHRTKEMLPSYESIASENNNVPVGPAKHFITERRKSPCAETTVQTVAEFPTEANLPEPSAISDKDIREIEQMYKELKATSEMSAKLITAMRRCKTKGATPQQDQNMRQACTKLKKWYERSMHAFNHSMRIIGSIQRMNNGVTEQRPTACPSPLLSQEQQRTVENFNLSTGQFRSMIEDLQLAMNDSDIENRPPPASLPSSTSSSGVTKVPAALAEAKSSIGVLQSKCPKDVIVLPERGTTANRNPLMPLNVLPLPQRDSPLMSPLAKKLPAAAEGEATTPNLIRRELQYDKENDGSVAFTETQSNQRHSNDVPQTKSLAPSVGSVVEIFDETTDNASVNPDNDAHSNENDERAPHAENCTRDYFGFNEEDDEVVENSVTQVTLPMPLNISNETLHHRLHNVKQLLPKRPIFRRQPKQLQTRSSGPTRFPTKSLRVFSSPTKRPHTLREFVASTPRPGGGVTSTEQAAGPSAATKPFVIDAPDVSVIEPNCENVERNVDPDVVLFDTPDRPAWLNNSAHQKTYARVPKLRKKKKNIYLANLGLDDDDDEEEEEDPAGSDDGQELSSDSETDEAKRKKNKKQRKAKRKPVPVEQTKDFKEFVDNFNSMCEEVERYELIVE